MLLFHGIESWKTYSATFQRHSIWILESSLEKPFSYMLNHRNACCYCTEKKGGRIYDTFYRTDECTKRSIEKYSITYSGDRGRI